MPTRVLLVDDHDAFRIAARAMLEADGFDVVGEAATAAEARARVADLEPEVVLLDVQLPDVDGITLTPELVTSGAAVVLISTRAEQDYGEQLSSCGAIGFVPKSELSGPRVAALLARPVRPR